MILSIPNTTNLISNILTYSCVINKYSVINKYNRMGAKNTKGQTLDQIIEN